MTAIFQLILLIVAGVEYLRGLIDKETNALLSAIFLLLMVIAGSVIL